MSFQSDGRAVQGVVVRVNTKTLSIHTKDAHWNIHPRFVTKLPEAGGEAPPIIGELESRREPPQDLFRQKTKKRPQAHS